MSKLVEAMARVLEPTAWAALGTGDTLIFKARRTSSLRAAKACLRAMAEVEPSEAAIDAVRKIQWELSGCQFIRDDYVALYRAMLTQAVAEAESVQ